MLGSFKYKGISFPFRFSPKGGVAISEANYNNPAHIIESIQQIIMTKIGERVMETDFGSEVSNFILSSNYDDVDITLLKHIIKESIELHDKRVEVKNVNIEISKDEEETNNNRALEISIDFIIKKFGKLYTTKITM